jgi:hypothetical protein
MDTPLFTNICQKYRNVVEHDAVFFQLCCDHLGFLVSEYGFDIKCNRWGGPEFGPGISFSDDSLKISVDMLGLYGLPVLIVRSMPHPNRLFKLSKLAETYGFKNDMSFRFDGDIDKEVVLRKYNDTIEDRIARFGVCIHDNMDLFMTALRYEDFAA